MRPFPVLVCAAVVASCEGTSGLTGGGDDRTDAGGPHCPTGQKVCSGTCVEIGDPKFGCTETSCEACIAPAGTSVRCDPGKCRVSSCDEGFDDCDRDPSNGCETDLTKPTSCGSCTRNCPSDARFCDRGQCSTTCSPGTADCNGSCVDLDASAQNCGSCANECPSARNARATCIDKKCGIRCSAGFGECDGDPTTCEPLTPYYVDGDGDGFGAGDKVGDACTAPLGHSLTNDDCNDKVKAVHPGQTGYFTTGYVDAMGATSYDYDCSGKEDSDPSKAVGGACGPPCVPGYQPSTIKRPVGANTYCGSTTIVVCSSSCLTSSSQSTLGCR